MATSSINIRIDTQLKENVDKILKDLGLTKTEVIRMFLAQIVINRAIPIDLKTNNNLPAFDESIEDIETIPWYMND